MVVQAVGVGESTRNTVCLFLGGAAFLAALIPMRMPYQVFGLDMTGTAGAIVARTPWAMCVLVSLCMPRGGAARPWWVILSAPLAFPKVLALAIAYIVWSIGGFV